MFVPSDKEPYNSSRIASEDKTRASPAFSWINVDLPTPAGPIKICTFILTLYHESGKIARIIALDKVEKP